MQPENLFSVLSSKVRIEILNILASKSGSVKDILKELQTRSILIKYRESVYRDLEKLVGTGLVEKYYDNKDKGIRYRLLITKIQVDFRTGEISQTDYTEAGIK